MRIVFSLKWAPRTVPFLKAFKSAETRALFHNYTNRISKFVECQISGNIAQDKNQKGILRKTWICERTGRDLSSEALSQKLQGLLNSGCRELQIVIGGADGFSTKERELLKPDFQWSFGALTLPHELAAVVASEQVYRAWTILKGLPYHTKH
ncbi:MAG: 23S rRNA (pseudouridine(1915)-N(3))-methyltransferase RlmH [Candidatus Omnitrophica bacterium]|nr:23S rRNA (pseudouridine(1915)-N(3))-methyltransferase RlmH [Candidatus Omnitrophota bacterium]